MALGPRRTQSEAACAAFSTPVVLNEYLMTSSSEVSTRWRCSPYSRSLALLRRRSTGKSGNQKIIVRGITTTMKMPSDSNIYDQFLSSNGPPSLSLSARRARVPPAPFSPHMATSCALRLIAASHAATRMSTSDRRRSHDGLIYSVDTMADRTPPLSQATGYGVILGLGFLFA
nr:hypothetical protein CFP56_70196 [Quercus suber]